LVSRHERKQLIARSVLIAVIALAVGYGLITSPINCLRSIHLDESLYSAAQKGNVKEMRRLIAAGADVDGRFDGNDPVLIAAVESGSVEAVKLLLQHGVNPNVNGASENKPAVRIAKRWPKIRELLLAAGAKDN
jgi:ankyrin repeat protein